MVLVGLALGIIGNLVMEDRPQDLLAEVRIVAVKILVGAEDSEHIMLRCQTILDILELLSALKGIRGHPESADPHVIPELALTRGSFGSVAKAAVALIGMNNRPVGVGKDAVVARTPSGPRLRQALAGHLLGLLLKSATRVRQRRWRGRVGTRHGLVRPATPGRRAAIDRGPDTAGHGLGIGDLDPKAILVGEGVVMLCLLGRGNWWRNAVRLGEQAWLPLEGRFARLPLLGDGMPTRGAGKVEMDRFGEETIQDLCQYDETCWTMTGPCR
jgi:hypothetical protein